MAKSLDDVLRQIQNQRNQEIARQNAIKEQREKDRRRWIDSNRINEKASALSSSSSSSAGGGSIEPIIQTIPVVEITSFTPGSFTPRIDSIVINVVSDGHSEVTSRGIVYGVAPEIAVGLSPSSQFNSGSGVGEFTLLNIDVSDFIGETVYLRAFAINLIGVGYSDLISWEPEICLAKGTKILLSNGIDKNIEDIEYEDSLLVWNFDDGRLDTSKPLWIKKVQATNKYNLLKFSDGTELKTISQHRIFNKESGMFTYPMTDDTPTGTTTFNQLGEEISLLSKEIVHDKIEYYNIITNYHINLFANSILTSCRYNNIYPIDNMKFVKDNRSVRPREEFIDISDDYYRGLRLSEQTFDLEEMQKYIKRLEKLDIRVLA